MFSSGDGFECVPSAFLAYFDAFRIAVAQVADYCLAVCGVDVWNSARACVNAFRAASTFFLVHEDRAGFLGDRQCFEGACFDAGVVFALCAEVWEFGSGD